MPIVRRKALPCERIGETELMVCDKANKKFYLLNSSARLFYSLCSEKQIDEIEEQFITAYKGSGVSEDKLRNNARRVFEELIRAEILEVL